MNDIQMTKLDSAIITQGGVTEEDRRRNRDAVLRALGAEQEAV